MFQRFSTGAKTNRDEIVYDFSSAHLRSRIEKFVEAYNAEVDRFRRLSKRVSVDDFVDPQRVKWSSTLKLHLQRGRYAEFDPGRTRASLYRPFCRRYLYYDEILIDRPGLFRLTLPTPVSETENAVLCLTNHLQIAFSALCSNAIANEAVGGRAGCCFPFYIYDENGTNRRENITDWALQLFREHYQDPAIGKWDIFYYVYGVLHHPGYRAKFADNLKRELPRIPLAPALSCGTGFQPVSGQPDARQRQVANLSHTNHPAAASGFWAFSAAGKELAHWHLDYEQVEPYPLRFVEKKTIGPDGPDPSPTRQRGASVPDQSPTRKRGAAVPDQSPKRERGARAALPGATRTIDDLCRVEDKMRLSKDKTELAVNPLLTLEGIPPEVFEYRLGNRSALEWVIDQYQVTTDKRSGIRSDPNRPDDPEYIVRLVGQVVRVSLETVRIVRGLPERYAPDG